MPRAFKRGIIIACLCIAIFGSLILFTPPSDSKSHHRSIPSVPNNPVGIETVSLGQNGLCMGFGHHDSNGGHHTIFGLSYSGLAVHHSPFDFMKQWTASEACGDPNGFSGNIGLEWGQHPASDATTPYVTAGYSIQLGTSWTVQLVGGAFYSQLNIKRIKTPMTLNADGLFPFALLEVKDKF